MTWTNAGVSIYSLANRIGDGKVEGKESVETPSSHGAAEAGIVFAGVPIPADHSHESRPLRMRRRGNSKVVEPRASKDRGGEHGAPTKNGERGKPETSNKEADGELTGSGKPLPSSPAEGSGRAAGRGIAQVTCMDRRSARQ